jgi:hypothetical protein
MWSNQTKQFGYFLIKVLKGNLSFGLFKMQDNNDVLRHRQRQGKAVKTSFQETKKK